MPFRSIETWPHGAIMLDAEHTQFALWAPDAFTSVSNSKTASPCQCCPRQTAGL